MNTHALLFIILSMQMADEHEIFLFKEIMSIIIYKIINRIVSICKIIFHVTVRINIKNLPQIESSTCCMASNAMSKYVFAEIRQ